jgi:hypothetical protein
MIHSEFDGSFMLLGAWTHGPDSSHARRRLSDSTRNPPQAAGQSRQLVSSHQEGRRFVLVSLRDQLQVHQGKCPLSMDIEMMQKIPAFLACFVVFPASTETVQRSTSYAMLSKA